MNETPDEYDESIEIGANPHALADSLCDDFVIEIDPISDVELLKCFFHLPADVWHPLEAVASSATQPLPNCVSKLLNCAPKQIFMRHAPWIGRSFDRHQPSHMVTIANAASMGVNTFLIAVPD